MSDAGISESYNIAQQIRSDRGWRAKLLRFYWRQCFRLTKLIDSHSKQELNHAAQKSIMNYGCGNKFLHGAINVDLCAPHRFLLGKRRPDIYWSGTAALPWLSGRLDGIVCEHVIEHILPDDVSVLFENFKLALKQDGVIVISFPDVKKVLSGGYCQGYSTTSATLNSMIYRHGHCFMYDTELVSQLLHSAGFKGVRAAEFDDLPLKEFISQGRSGESSYVVAECPGQAH